MGELQTLPSAHRKKQRYLIYDLIGEQHHSFGAVVDAFWEGLLSVLGESGVAAADPWIMKDLFDESSQRGGVRVDKGNTDAVRAALALITEIEDSPVTVHVVAVTGTIKSAREKYL